MPARPDDLPTADELRAMFDYDPVTGDLTRKWHHLPQCQHLIGKPTGTFVKGYLRVRIKGRLYYAHRVIWAMQTGEWPTVMIDHENTDRGDNAWVNLREATRAQNQHNQRTRNPLGKGVHRTASGKFEAKISLGGRIVYLGTHSSVVDAAEAYAIAAEKHFGDFARPV